jgi:hypothetical protein
MEGQASEKVPEQVGEPVTTDVEPQTPVEHYVAHDPSADVRIRRKLDLHMMPLFFVLCAYHGAPFPVLLILIIM